MSLSTRRVAAVSFAGAIMVGSMGGSAFASTAHQKPTVKSLQAQIAKLKRQLAADEGAISIYKGEITQLQKVKTPTKTTAPTTTPTTTAAPRTLLTLSGSGGLTSQPFTSPGPWNLNYSYDCSNFGGSGNFAVTPQSSTDDLSAFQDEGVNVLGAGGQATSYQPSGGTFSLSINSECSWTISVVTAG